MKYGDIDPIFENRMDIVVVDQELLFHAVRRRFRFWKYDIGLTDFHRRIIRFLLKEEKKKDVDQIVVVTTKVPQDFVERTINNFLKLNFSVSFISDEQTYKTWLSIINPIAHYCTYDRINYHRNTVQVTGDLLANQI